MQRLPYAITNSSAALARFEKTMRQHLELSRKASQSQYKRDFSIIAWAPTIKYIVDPIREKEPPLELGASSNSICCPAGGELRT